MEATRPPLTIVPNLTRAEAMEAERQAELKAIAELRKVRAAKRKARERAKHAPGTKWQPSAKQRHFVAIALTAGLTQEQIAGTLGVSPKVLADRCKAEIEAGPATMNGRVAAKLYQQCMKGNTIALIYWTKTRLGWRETSRTEHTGADGGPIAYERIEAEAKAFTDHIEQLATRFVPPMPANDAAAGKSAAPVDLKVNKTGEA